MYRYIDQTISSPIKIGVWRVVVEDSLKLESFLLIVRTGWIFTVAKFALVPPDTSDVPAYSQIRPVTSILAENVTSRQGNRPS